ncbi:MAG: transglycosylase SLT domain-containing protein [Deltaproteobacteria bacterium]|nr:MAG: transglycosylase SLT domain-containing protein [Deltaproteobacteria bacterium]
MSAKSQHMRLATVGLLLAFLIASILSCAYFPLHSKHLDSARVNLPYSITLCNEPIPLESPSVWEKLDREFTIAVWDRPQVILWLKRAGRYFPYLEKKLAEEGLPEDLKYLAVAESALITGIRSSKGAVGLWQLMAPTGREYGLRKNQMIDERLDFERATEAALNYIKNLRNTFANWALVLAAYNCGEYHLKREIRKQKVDDFYSLNLPSETERFIFRIAAIKIIMENPHLYGYHLEEEQIYQPLEYDTVQVKINKHLHLAYVAAAIGSEYRVLKELNPHILRHQLPTGQYTIKVPLGSEAKLTAALQQLDNNSSGEIAVVSSSHYVVEAGDTLSHIAVRTGISVTTLRRLNNIQGSLLKVGQRLQLAP